MRTRLAALTVVALALAGCGGDDGEPEAGAPTAAEFIDCFELAGHEAVRPKPREESVLAFQAKREGYEVEPVNVTKRGMLSPEVFLVIFESPEKAREAIDKLDATSFGEVPPQRVGPAVIGYGDDESRRAVEPAIERCL